MDPIHTFLWVKGQQRAAQPFVQLGVGRGGGNNLHVAAEILSSSTYSFTKQFSMSSCAVVSLFPNTSSRLSPLLPRSATAQH